MSKCEHPNEGIFPTGGVLKAERCASCGASRLWVSRHGTVAGGYWGPWVRRLAEHLNTSSPIGRRKWNEQLRQRVFPMRLCTEPAAPDDYKDELRVKTICRLTLLDRLKLLLTGCLVVETRTKTEHVIGDSRTTSAIYVALPAVERKRVGESRWDFAERKRVK